MSINSYPGFIIENTTIAVDYWPKQRCSEISHFFLTHAHKDHTKNLDSSWTGPIFYCSKITKMLVENINLVNKERIKELELDQVYTMNLNDDESFNVTLLDSNHVPGAVMYLFEGYFGHILATGDFRYCPEMFVDTPLANNSIDICYLDNTYFNRAFANIPTRQEALNEIITIINVKKSKAKKIIFQLHLKSVGKETLLVDLYKHFKIPIYVSRNRYDRLVNVLSINKTYFTTDITNETLICVKDQCHLSSDCLSNTRKVIDIEPSALNAPLLDDRSDLTDYYSKSKTSYFKVAYTDHSSYTEIKEFVKKLRPKRLEPIVRTLLPGSVDPTAHLSDLDEFLNKSDPIVDCRDKFNLLLQSRTHIRRYERMHTIEVSKRIIKKTTDGPVLRRSPRSVSKRIEYETPEKEKELDTSTSNKSLSPSEKENNSKVISLQNGNRQSFNDANNKPRLSINSTEINLNSNEITDKHVRYSLRSSRSNNLASQCSTGSESTQWKKISAQVEMLVGDGISISDSSDLRNSLNSSDANLQTQNDENSLDENSNHENAQRSPIIELTSNIEIINLNSRKNLELNTNDLDNQLATSLVIERSFIIKENIDENEKEKENSTKDITQINDKSKCDENENAQESDQNVEVGNSLNETLKETALDNNQSEKSKKDVDECQNEVFIQVENTSNNVDGAVNNDAEFFDFISKALKSLIGQEEQSEETLRAKTLNSIFDSSDF